MRYFNKRKRTYILGSVVLTTLLVPEFVFAQASNIPQLIGIFGNILQSLTPILVALALVYFFWGIAQFIIHADDENARIEGRRIMVWGIIALFVIVSVWGLVAVLNNTFVGRGTAPPVPGLPG